MVTIPKTSLLMDETQFYCGWSCNLMITDRIDSGIFGTPNAQWNSRSNKHTRSIFCHRITMSQSIRQHYPRRSYKVSDYQWHPWLNIGTPTPHWFFGSNKHIKRFFSRHLAVPQSIRHCTSEKPLCFPFLPGPDGSGSLQHIHQRPGKNSPLEKTLTLWLNRFSATAGAASTSLQQSWQLNPHSSCCLQLRKWSRTKARVLCIPFSWDHCGIYGNHIKIARDGKQSCKSLQKQHSEVAEKRN